MALSKTYPKKSLAKDSAGEEGSSRGELKGRKILLGISSTAVLSRIAAKFLKEQGAEIELIHFRFGPLTSRFRYAEDRPAIEEDAIQEWAKKLGLSLAIIDLKKESDAFTGAWAAHTYNQGWTPDIKGTFDSDFLIPQLLHFAKDRKAEVATGHRARIHHTGGGESRLLKSKDESLDQSSLLGQVKNSHVKKLHLPMGHLKESDLVKLAQDYNLSSRPELCCSDLCEIPSFESLRAHLDSRSMSRVKTKGVVITAKKVILGEHKGIATAPVGMKKSYPEMGESSSRVVLGHDLMKNWVIAGYEEQMNRGSCVTSEVNWVSSRPDFSRVTEEFNVQWGSNPREKHTTSLPVTVKVLLGSSLQITHVEKLEEPRKFRPPLGALVTLYRGTLCLGSARVLESFS